MRASRMLTLQSKDFMNFQMIIVLVIIAAAFVYAGVLVAKKTKSFSPKSDCGGDCGCNGAAKKLPS